MTYLLDATHLAGSAQARLRILATDGDNTSQDDSAAFSVERKQPEAAIVSLEQGNTYPAGEPLRLQGSAWDEEDGLLPGANLTWTDSISGTLGAGEVLYTLPRVQGAHTITLTATDSDGMTGTYSVQIHIGYRIYLPVILK